MKNKTPPEKKFLVRIADYKAVFGSAQGKRVLYDMMRAHFVLSTTHCKGDPHESAMKEGERLAVLRIMSMIKLDPQALEKLITEEAQNENNS